MAKAMPVVILTLIILAFLSGCTITHQYGEFPKLKVNTNVADDVELKFKKDGVRIKFEWEI